MPETRQLLGVSNRLPFSFLLSATFEPLPSALWVSAQLRPLLKYCACALSAQFGRLHVCCVHKKSERKRTRKCLASGVTESSTASTTAQHASSSTSFRATCSGRALRRWAKAACFAPFPSSSLSWTWGLASTSEARSVSKGESKAPGLMI